MFAVESVHVHSCGLTKWVGSFFWSVDGMMGSLVTAWMKWELTRKRIAVE